MKDQLIEKAREASALAHAPYSNFQVGAALLAENGEIFTGGNVECSSYGGTICAERSALCSAVAAGNKRFRMIAVYTNTRHPTPPCGICRQLLNDFSPEMTVISACRSGEVLEHCLSDLLPEAFSSGNLE